MSKTSTTKTLAIDAPVEEGARLAYVENEISLGSLTPEELRDNRPTLSEAIAQRRREDERLKAMGQNVKFS